MNELRLIQNRVIERLNNDDVNHAQVSLMIGVSKGWVSLYSRGKLKNPSIERVADLLDALDKLDSQNSIHTKNEAAASKTQSRRTPTQPEPHHAPAPL